MTDFNMKLPDPLLSFEILDGVNFTDDDRKLALALGNDVKFGSMTSAFKCLFCKFFFFLIAIHSMEG